MRRAVRRRCGTARRSPPRTFLGSDSSLSPPRARDRDGGSAARQPLLEPGRRLGHDRAAVPANQNPHPIPLPGGRERGKNPLASLSIDEIRARYVEGGKPVPSRLLTKLK